MLLKEFSTIFDRPEKVKKLRAYILSLAVRGKLVEQDENDEPASILLNRIREEKDRLVKEKKFKKEKPLPEISEDEIPYELPKGWEWVRLGELGNIFNGNSINAKLKESKYSNIKEGYNYIATKDVDLQSRTINYENGIKIPFDEEKFRIAHEGSILICAEGGSAGKKVALVEEDICFGNKLLAIELFYKMNSKYLFYIYQSSDFFERFSSLMTGIIGGISSKNFKEIPVSLPPLNEQNRIVEKVDYLMKFCDKLEEQLEKQVKYGSLSAKSVLNGVSNCSSYEELEEALRFIIENFKDLTLADGAVDELKNAILSLAVKGKLVPQDDSDEPASVLIKKIREEKDRLVKENKIKKEKALPQISDDILYELPKGWEWVRLGDIGFSNIGLTYKPSDISTEGIPVLRSMNIQDGKIVYNDLVYVNTKVSEDKMCKKGDILICARNGSKKLVGKCAIIEDEGMSFGAFMAIYRSECNNYINRFINSSVFKIQLGGVNTTTINQITQNTLKNIVCPLPPLEEQKRIVEKVDKLMKVCDELELIIEKSKKYSEQLMKSILKKHMG